MVLSLIAVALAGELSLVALGDSGLPLRGATVEVAGQTLHTDAWGRVATELPDGTWTVTLDHVDLGEVRIDGEQQSELIARRTGVGWRVTVEEPSGTTASAAHEEAVAGVLSGVVRDEEGQPVAGARVLVRGAAEQRTDASGAFALERPAGTWDLTVVAPGYATRTLRDQPLDTPIDVVLPPAGLALDAFTVSAPAVSGGTADLLAERQASASVADSIGSEEMSRSGASTAAAALTRVTGLTVVGGKYVYVRGLGERYASTLLDGASLPSPEPERRVVPLDLFPAGMLSRVVVQKSYSPDMPGEFGGGVIALDTRRVPDEPFFQVNLSTGGDSQSTGRSGLSYDTGPTDLFGIDGGYRALPDGVAEASATSPLEEGDRFSDRGYTADKLQELGQSMPNRWNTRDLTLAPDIGLTLSGGGSTETPLGRLGLLAGATWSHAWNNDRFDKDYILVGGGGEVEVAHRYRFDSTTRDVRLGGLGALTLDAERHTWSLTSLLARSTEDEARIYEGFNRDVGGDIRVTRLRFVERQLWTTRLGAEHRPSDTLTVDWRYSLSRAGRLEPDRRELRFDNEQGTEVWLLSDRPEGNQRVFSELSDWGHDVAANVRLGGERLSLRAGVQGVLKQRGVDTRRYKFVHKGPGSRDAELLAQDAETIFAADNIGADAFQFEEITRSTDNYAATQRLGAVYLLSEAELTPSTRVLAGARVESSTQRVSTFELFSPNPDPVVATLSTTDLLPAVTLTQALTDDTMQLRLGYGRTVNRPDFRELSPATFNDVTGGRQTFGNAELQRALIDHVDLRWEWYPSAGETLSVAAFGKFFTDPIEQVVVVSAQHSVTFDNVDGATNLGVEVEGRKDLSFLHPAWSSAWVSGNVALIRSRVTLGDTGGIETSSERALQGQSPFAVNLQLGWAHPSRRSALTALFNLVGPRITEAGALGAPDAYEVPGARLDLVGQLDLGRGWALSVKANNLLDSATVERQGGHITSTDRDGVSATIGLSWRMGE